MTQRLLLIGESWRAGSGSVIRSVNPADGSTVAEFPGASPADVDEAVAAGARAMSDANWRDRHPHQRAAILHRISDGLRAVAPQLAQLQTADTGKTYRESLALVESAAGTFGYIASVLETMEDVLPPARGNYFNMSVHEPLGVVAAISPWNSPVASDAQKIAPALAAGNAVVVKPAEWTPLVSLELARICLEAGLPPGLLSVLPGSGSVVGEALVRHSQIRKVSFTGGTLTGRRIARIAAEKLMPAALELGGKSPTIVFEDADIEHALAGVLYGIFSSSGQSCVAGSRLFVARSIYDDFVAELVRRAETLRVGPPLDSRTQVAPLVSLAHRESVQRYVDLARAEGGAVLCGGAAPSGAEFSAGAYFLPTIVGGLKNDSRTCREEIFGPVLVALPFDDESDLVAAANDSSYGLSCGIWTRDYRRAWRVARTVEAGTVWINTYKQLSIATPFGGWKDSGLGREKGSAAVRGYMQQKSLYWGLNDEPLPWSLEPTH